MHMLSFFKEGEHIALPMSVGQGERVQWITKEPVVQKVLNGM